MIKQWSIDWEQAMKQRESNCWPTKAVEGFLMRTKIGICLSLSSDALILDAPKSLGPVALLTGPVSNKFFSLLK